MFHRAGSDRLDGTSCRQDLAVGGITCTRFVAFHRFTHLTEGLAYALFVIPRRHHLDMASSICRDSDPLIRILDRQLDVITRRQALTVGLTRHALGHRL